MELELARTYYITGTNGVLRLNGVPICYTIELPWQENKRNYSCIPEGRYRLERRFSERFKGHFELKAVPNRTLILIHPANDAATELKGCIAPVSALTGPGKGARSKEAFAALRKVVAEAFDRKEPVWVNITPLVVPATMEAVA